MARVVYYSFSKLSEAAQNMFLDCVSVLYWEDFDQAMLVWEAWWPGEARRAFRRLQQLSLVSTDTDRRGGRQLVVLDVIRSLGQSMFLSTGQLPGLVDVGRYYGSRIWTGPDGQPVGIVEVRQTRGASVVPRALPDGLACHMPSAWANATPL